MNKAFSATLAAIAASMATSAFAGGYVAPVQDVPPAPAAKAAPSSFSWTGGYAGASMGHTKLDLKRSLIVEEPAQVIQHPAVTDTITVITPAVTEEVTVPAVTEEVEHPAVTETVVIPPVTEDRIIPAVTKEIRHDPVMETYTEVIDHPAEVELTPIVESQKVWVPTPKDQQFGGCHHGNDTCPVRDPSHHSGWKHEDVVTGHTETAVKEAWQETIIKDRIVKDAWVETLIVTPERRETVVIEPGRTETKVVKEAWTETKVIKPATTETKVITPAKAETKEIIVKPAWTEVVRDAFAATLIEDFSEMANSYGVFGGYRHQLRNNIVAGVEASYTKGKDISASFDNETFTFDLSTLAIEAQLGYSFGRALPYIAAGAAHADGGNGWQAAVGIDYALTDSLFVGARYTKQDFDDLSGWKADSDTVSLRVGLNF